MRSPVVEAVESFHLRRPKGRNVSRIQSPTVQIGGRESPAWALMGWSNFPMATRASGRLISE